MHERVRPIPAPTRVGASGMRFRPALALLVVALAAILAAGTQSAVAAPRVPWVVEDLGNGRSVIAGHRAPLPWAAQTMARLVRRWGDPTRVRDQGSDGCTAVWTTPRVVVDLANYGGVPDRASVCEGRWGLIQTLRTAGPRWRTARGLRVGMREAAIPRRYPTAFPRSWFGLGRVWLLRPYWEECVGDCPGQTHVPVSAVVAIIRGGKVAGFSVSVFAAGE